MDAYTPQNLILADDMNITLSTAEKKGGLTGKDIFRSQVESLIQTWDLLDIKPKKGKFTWSNKRRGKANIMARLDRFLVQSSLLIDGQIVISKIMANLASDHKPILLQIQENEDLGPILFRFSPSMA